MSAAEWKVGDRVITENSGLGTVAYYGATEFADGVWVGVILDEPRGKNNGTVKDKQYFHCDENCGTFLRPDRVRVFYCRGVSAFILPFVQLKRESVKASGLKAPSSIKKPTTRTPEQSVGKAKFFHFCYHMLQKIALQGGTTPRSGMTPAASKEQLSSAMKASESKESISSDKAASKQPPHSSPKKQQQLPTPAKSHLPTATPSSQQPKQSTPEKKPVAEQPKEPVARRVSELQQQFDRVSYAKR